MCLLGYMENIVLPKLEEKRRRVPLGQVVNGNVAMHACWECLTVEGGRRHIRNAHTQTSKIIGINQT